LIAIIGDNGSTELSDYVVPFGILSHAGVADVMALSTQAGPIKTVTDLGKPSFQIQGEATMAQFDTRFPDGADYIVVPATHNTPALAAWLAQQSNKGATIVSICNGAMVVAMSGAMNGRQATAHWSTEDDRLHKQPQVHWVKNARYTVDGNWVSSAGVSAALPTSVALVEAIAGHDRAEQLAQELAVDDWTPRHNSDAFQPRLGVNLMALVESVYTNEWLHNTDRIGIPAATGVNEVALALMVDAYSTTGRSQAYVVAQTTAPLRTQHGLVMIADLAADATGSVDRMLPALDSTPAGKILDKALADITTLYGRTNAYGVALLLEYPGLRD
jgi:putative intracellular protease/amidase